MARIVDAVAQYAVIAEYSEYEVGYSLYVSEDAARRAFEEHKAKGTETYLCKIMEAGQ